MKIAIVCFNIFIAGGARLVCDLARSLGKLGHRVTIYAPGSSADHYRDIMKDLDIRIVEPPMPITAYTSGRARNFMSRITRKFRQDREFIAASKLIASRMDDDFDVVNVQDEGYRVGFYYKKRNPKAGVVWTINGQPFLYIKRGNFFVDLIGRSYHFARNILNKKYLKVINGVISLDAYNKKWIGNYGLRDVAVIRGGIDFQKFYSPVKNFRGKASAKAVQLLALGALNPYRRYEDVILAVKYLRDSGYDAKAVVVASNIWREDEYKERLLALRRENNLDKFVDLKFDGVPDTELRKAYGESDIFVQAVYVTPPGNHGWGLVNFEAMAGGLPVILCNAATALEVLSDGENVLSVPPMSPGSIAERVKFLVDHPEKYDEIAKAGQKLVRETMSWDKYAREVAEVFRAKQNHGQ